MSENIISRATLPLAERDMLEELIARDPNDLNSEQTAHLRARGAYLTADEKAKHAKAFEPEKPTLKSIDRMNGKEVIEELKSLGYEVDEKAPVKELKEALTTAREEQAQE